MDIYSFFFRLRRFRINTSTFANSKSKMFFDEQTLRQKPLLFARLVYSSDFFYHSKRALHLFTRCLVILPTNSTAADARSPRLRLWFLSWSNALTAVLISTWLTALRSSPCLSDLDNVITGRIDRNRYFTISVLTFSALFVPFRYWSFRCESFCRGPFRYWPFR